MESETLTLIFWVLILIISNLSVILLFGRSVHNLIKLIVDAYADGVLIDNEIEQIQKEASILTDNAVKLYRAFFRK